MYRTIYDEKSKQWHGLEKRPLYHPQATLGEVLLKSMHVNGSRIAQISDESGVQLTYNDLHERTIRAALNLRARGYEKGQVFTFMAKNSENLAPIVIAAFSIGCPINPLATSFGKTEIVHMLSITKPSLVFCDADCHGKLVESLQELGNDAKIITFNGKVGDSEQVEDLLVETGTESTFIPTPIDGSKEIAGIFCSSGTTALPKGVSLSHATLLTGQFNFELVQSHDILLCFSELYWMSGIFTLIWGILFGGTRIITTDTFSPELAFRLIPQYQVSFVLNAVHQMVSMVKHQAIAQANLTSLKNYTVGGGKVQFSLLTEFSAYFPNGKAHNLLGMTETAAVYASADSKYYTKESAGQLIHGVVVKLVDDEGNRCGVNVDGEICLKLPYNFLGYYNNPEATEQAFDNEGFLITGDVGNFDENGNLYVVDRKKEMMKYCNYQITPSEIEEVLIQSPDIVATCVVSIPDIVATDLPAAVIKRKNGSNITAKDVHDMVAENLADHYKLRGGVYFVDSLPMTASGKIQRKQVREMLLQTFSEQQNAA